jgi:hypothetical protein
MPIRTIVLRLDEEDFKALEAKKMPKESWEKMIRRELSVSEKK